MAQITNASTIRQIELIAYAVNPHFEARAWNSGSLECRRDRHRHGGQFYSFTTEILQVRCGERGRTSWEALIVNERWAGGEPEAVFRHAKWMKLLAGSAADLRAWIRRNRLTDAQLAATSEPEPTDS